MHTDSNNTNVSLFCVPCNYKITLGYKYLLTLWNVLEDAPEREEEVELSAFRGAENQENSLDEDIVVNASSDLHVPEGDDEDATSPVHQNLAPDPDVEASRRALVEEGESEGIWRDTELSVRLRDNSNAEKGNEEEFGELSSESQLLRRRRNPASSTEN